MELKTAEQLGRPLIGNAMHGLTIAVPDDRKRVSGYVVEAIALLPNPEAWLPIEVEPVGKARAYLVLNTQLLDIAIQIGEQGETLTVNVEARFFERRPWTVQLEARWDDVMDGGVGFKTHWTFRRDSGEEPIEANGEIQIDIQGDPERRISDAENFALDAGRARWLEDGLAAARGRVVRTRASRSHLLTYSESRGPRAVRKSAHAPGRQTTLRRRRPTDRAKRARGGNPARERKRDTRAGAWGRSFTHTRAPSRRRPRLPARADPARGHERPLA